MQDVNLLDLINAISQALDCMSPAVTGHHRRVAIMSAAMAEALQLSEDDSIDLIMASLLHDIGAFSLNLPLDGLEFDTDMMEHAEQGYRLLAMHPAFNTISLLVKHHHDAWKTMDGKLVPGDNIALLANIISLTDRVDILHRIRQFPLRRSETYQALNDYRGTLFAPQALDAFAEIAHDDAFWQRIDDTHTPLPLLIGPIATARKIPHHQLLLFSDFFSCIIDFRCRFTSTHSQGVAATATLLARLAGMDTMQQRRMRLAGNLHDIGKLSVPITLLEKPGKLTPLEFEEVKKHALVCEHVLKTVPGLNDIAGWASQHHERLNGLGYPHGLKDSQIPLGSRIMAVADVCTAISEDRPYRAGMKPDTAMRVLLTMAKERHLDAAIVQLALDNYGEIDALRRQVQCQARSDFEHFRNGREPLSHFENQSNIIE